CLWSPGLSSGVRSRATVIRSGAPDGPAPWGPPPLVTEGVALHVEEVTDLDDDEVDALPEPDRYIVEPDGAVVRAGLVRRWARRQRRPLLDHLTGPESPVGHTGFEVLRRCRLDRKELRRELRERDCGSLEILVRGVDTDPDALRRSLSLRGTRALALVVTRIGRSAVVLVCGPRTSAATVQPNT